MKFAILIQVASTNWNGGKDFSIKEIDGEVIYKKTLEACLSVSRLLVDKGHQAEICFIIPDRENERKYFETELESKRANFFFGDEKDVLNRILDCAVRNGFEHIYRVNGSFWYLENQLVSELVDLYATGDYDLVKLTASFPHGFSGELFSFSALTKLRSIRSETIVNPVSAFSETGKFQIFELTPKPNVIDPVRVEFIRSKRLQYEPERAEYNESALIVAGSIYYNIYHKSLDYIKSTDIVLDIASGEGYGSEILSEKANYVHGGDYDIETIRRSTLKYTKYSNLNYVNVDVTNLPFKDDYFDVVTSMETVEHVDENLFVENVSRVLKKDGYLIVTPPQNNYSFNLTPWHVKEYSANEIRELLESKFTILKIYGCSSADIFEDSEVGDRMMIVAKKK